MTSGFDLFPWFKNFLYNPATDWQRFINPQFNVTLNQGDAAIENHVLARAGSYGKQLGRVQEVLDVLLEHLLPPNLSATEQRSVNKYRQTRYDVVGAVNEVNRDDGSGTSAADLERWLDALAELRAADPTQFQRYADRLRDFIAQTPPASGFADTTQSARKA